MIMQGPLIPVRGEVALRLAGRQYRLCLTLGALAELETALGAGSLGALGERLGAGGLTSADLIAILGAAMRGGGEAITDAELACLPLADGLPAVVDALGRLLSVTFASDTGRNER